MVVAAVMEVPSDGSGKEPCVRRSVGCGVVWLSGWCGIVVVPGRTGLGSYQVQNWVIGHFSYQVLVFYWVIGH